MQFNPKTYRLDNTASLGRAFLLIGILGLAIGCVGLITDPVRFFRSYLVAEVFWISLGIGALFFVLMHHLTGSVWSVVVRRIPEAMTATLMIMAVAFIPVLIGLHDLYPWSHPEAATEHAIAAKSSYLNPPFFIFRTVIYFGAMIWMAGALHRASLRQDRESHGDHQRISRSISARSVVPFAFICSFAAFDWLMSLTPSWYSTIFGVAFFCGAAVGALSLITLTAIFLHHRGVLKREITGEHYYDLGKLIFAFVIMWTYMSFSQYMLIWYANIPEEVAWYQQRSGSWLPLSLLLPVGHFIVPFVALMAQSAKRNLTVLTLVSLWLLVVHWLNLYWYVLPNFSRTIDLSWMDAALTVGLGGLFIWWFWRRLTAQALIPVGDPHLEESVNFVSEY
jgi:hypothetical protein